MNGIIQGKQEKQAGSLVWKSIYTAPNLANSIVIIRTKADTNTYMKIVDRANHVYYFPVWSFGRGEDVGEYNTNFKVWRDSVNYDYIYIAYDTWTYVHSLFSASANLSTNISSIELGTLE